MGTVVEIGGKNETDFTQEGVTMAARPKDMCPVHDIFCPVHSEVQITLRDIKAKQEARACGTHDVLIHLLADDIDEIKGNDSNQWSAINQLRRMVYMGLGGVLVTAFVGSIIGNLLINFLKR